MQADAATMTCGTTDVSRAVLRHNESSSEGTYLYRRPPNGFRIPLYQGLKNPPGKAILDKVLRIDVRPKYDEELNRRIRRIGGTVLYVQFILHATPAYRSFMTFTAPDALPSYYLLASERRGCRAPLCTGNQPEDAHWHKALPESL